MENSFPALSKVWEGIFIFPSRNFSPDGEYMWWKVVYSGELG